MDCECPAEAGVCMWRLIHGNYKASKQICCCLANVVFGSSRKLSHFTSIPSTLGEPPEGKVVRRSLRRQQPLTSQRVKSHLGMKVSVGGWNDWAPRDHQAARRGAGADVKYIIRPGAANGCATQIAFATFPQRFSAAAARGPKLFHLIWVQLVCVCSRKAQRCCHLIGGDWCRLQGHRFCCCSE